MEEYVFTGLAILQNSKEIGDQKSTISRTHSSSHKMTKYERIYGAGPRGIVLSIALFALVWKLEPAVGLPIITSSNVTRWSIFVVSVVGAISLAIWSAKSLPSTERGIILVTSGAYRYFRHPIYATFLSCFDFGLAILLNNWIYILWAIFLHPLWHLNIISEERLMRKEFPIEYDDYCAVTGRFFPKIRHRQ